MNGAATISPVHTVKICFCGHALAVHTVAPIPNATTDACNLCLTGTLPSLHRFTPADSITPSFPYSVTSKARFTNAGVAGLVGWITPPIIFASGLVSGGVANATLSRAAIEAVIPNFIPRPGDTITFYSGTGTSARRAGIAYRVTQVVPQGGNWIINFQPAALVTVTSPFIVRFAGADGSTQGAARPANGQRAG